MTDDELGYFSQNLWLYRVRRNIRRAAMSKGIMNFPRYRNIEYGVEVVTHDEAEALAARLQTDLAVLTRPPDYKWLMRNYRIRKLVEHYLLLSRGQRNMVSRLLRDLAE